VYSIENHVGRLIEARLATPFTAAEVEACISTIRMTIMGISQKVVFTVDTTGVDVLPPESADKFLAMMRADNPRVERTGYLLPPTSAIVGLQLERMIRDARSPARRTFRNPAHMEVWLSEVLNAREQEQLRKFMKSIATP
jgi:hypothetical protein